VAEKARTRFNAAGGHIGKLEKWALPQAHDSGKVRRVGREEWTTFIGERLDWDAMAISHNNGVRFREAEKRSILDQAYEDIRTDGYSKTEPGVRHGSAKYNQRANHRFFQFRDADAWQEYNARFGSGQDPFRVMLGHLDSMASDIAQMEMLGPNPLHGYAYLKEVAMDLAQRSRDPKAPDKARVHLAQADRMIGMLTGAANVPENKTRGMAMSAIRSTLTAAHLGSAVLSSVTDFNTNRIAARFVGMNQLGFMRQMGRLMRDAEFRNDANRLGLIFENAVDQGNAVARYELENLHVEAASRMADAVIRGSGLGYLTEVQRQSFGLEFMSTMASKWRAQSWDALDKPIRNALESYGWDADAWGALQGAGTYKLSNGLEVVRAQDIEANGNQRVADLYMETITQMTEFAVPSSDLHGRAFVIGTTKPGSLQGELIRAVLQFKAFPITMMTTQISRIMAEFNAGRKMSAVGYGANLVIGSTLLGAVALWMKDIVAGRDPREMTTPKAGWVPSRRAVASGSSATSSSRMPTASAVASVQTFTGPLDRVHSRHIQAHRGATFRRRPWGARPSPRRMPGASWCDTLNGIHRGALYGMRALRSSERCSIGCSAWLIRTRRSFSSQNRYPNDIGTQFFAPPGERLGDARLPDSEQHHRKARRMTVASNDLLVGPVTPTNGTSR
jgi:hypothetical protein